MLFVVVARGDGRSTPLTAFPSSQAVGLSAGCLSPINSTLHETDLLALSLTIISQPTASNPGLLSRSLCEFASSVHYILFIHHLSVYCKITTAKMDKIREVCVLPRPLMAG